ncbi:hypothetical protein GW17_00045536 [Ensete ventricosum]|nr:hypothetical protein GW17_00045536 [Ensete ventricosum]
MEDKLLKMSQDIEDLHAELRSMLEKVIADYKEFPGFKLGVQKTRYVSYEYGYRVALAQFRARLYFLIVKFHHCLFVCQGLKVCLSSSFFKEVEVGSQSLLRCFLIKVLDSKGWKTTSGGRIDRFRMRG